MTWLWLSSTLTMNTKIILEGKGPLTLRQNDYVATGGEGSVYRANSTVIKIYTDARKMAADRMAEKIKLLSKIRHDYIVSPQGLVFDEQRNPIGFYMPYAGAEPLPRVFTNDFRQRAGIGDNEAKMLAERMRETVNIAHQNGALMVDANELNWLAVIKGRGGPEPRVIDVDSWAIKNWKASVIMPSIRDWHSTNFTELTDWFAWGIVTFQIFAGIHPYKGTLAGYRPGEMERRMKDNASVFANGVQLNRAVRDFNLIPGALLDWYRAAFQFGERGIPPSVYTAGTSVLPAARVMHITTTAYGMLIFEKIFDSHGGRAIRVWPCGVALLESEELFDLGLKRVIGKLASRDGEVIKVRGGWLTAAWIGYKLSFTFIREGSLETGELPFLMNASKILRAENRLFIITDRGITEIAFSNIGRPVISPGQTWGALVNSTIWFDGIGVEDAMGAKFLVMPFGDDCLTHIRVPEIDGAQIVSAKFGNRVATLMALDKTGLYRKFEFVFANEYKTYRISESNADSPDINIACLPKGVNAEIINDGEIVISAPSAGKVNKAEDKNISADMELFNWEDAVLYIKNGSVWKLRMK